MRTVSAGLFHSVDGVVEAPNEWQFDSFDDEMGQEMGAMIGRVDTVILGRNGYSQWSQHWPAAGPDDPFAGFINPVKKYVASTTLTGTLDWENSELIDGDLVEFVQKLKNTDGGEISVMASISIVRTLLFAGVLDTLTLMTHPVIAGSGRRLFESGDPVTKLTLTSSRITSAGNAVLSYERRE